MTAPLLAWRAIPNPPRDSCKPGTSESGGCTPLTTRETTVARSEMESTHAWHQELIDLVKMLIKTSDV